MTTKRVMPYVTNVTAMCSESKPRMMAYYSSSEYDIGNVYNIYGFTIVTDDGEVGMDFYFDDLVDVWASKNGWQDDADRKASYRRWLIDTFVSIHKGAIARYMM